ncbi:MAG: DUF2851 family protein [Bacteroidota bacterium]|nr:DUF2851 family protein [Bacteroidota bacterium]
MTKLNLNENFICRIWEEKTYYSGLKTIDGEKVEMIYNGVINKDAGPDYKNAKIKIGNVLYSGSIEIHRSLKDWYLHNHKGDSKYNDLILHVVFYGNDIDEETANPVVKKSRSIPTIVLSEFLTRSIHDIWKEIINNPNKNFRIPCFQKNKEVLHNIKVDWLSILCMERLKYKSDRIKIRLEEITANPNKKTYWEQVLFEFICEALGYSKNKEQFLKLSKKINFTEFKKMNFNRLEIDSVLFGMSGFLFDLRFKDPYIDEIKSRWNNLKNILRKEIIDKSEWNFFRLRPPNFPTLRIAYASGILFEIINKDFFENIIMIFESSENVKRDLERNFMAVIVSDYWIKHYNFGRESKSGNKNIGRERIADVITNVLLPIVHLYSIIFEKEFLRNKVEFFYKKLKQKTSSNEVIRVMEDQFDFKVNTLAESQGLIHLYNFYCVNERCSECDIGKIVFKNLNDNEPLKIILY